MREAYIVAGYRSAVTKAKKGGFRFYRSDDLAADVIKYLLKSVPELDPKRVDDLIVGNAFPEAEQGLQVGRMIALQCLPQEVPGVTINRFCASGIDTISTAVARIRSGMMDCIIARVNVYGTNDRMEISCKLRTCKGLPWLLYEYGINCRESCKSV